MLSSDHDFAVLRAWEDTPKLSSNEGTNLPKVRLWECRDESCEPVSETNKLGDSTLLPSVQIINLKVIVKVDLHDERDKLRVMQRVSYISGVDSISMDMKDKKLTVIGDIDPASVLHKLRRTWDAKTTFVGPSEPIKKEELKKGSKKVELESGEIRKYTKTEDRNQHVSRAIPNYQPYNPSYPPYTQSYQPYTPSYQPHYQVHSVEENPNACVIC